MSNWAGKLRVENSALNEIVRAMTDEQIKTIRSQLEQDKTAHLKAEALAILDSHLAMRRMARELRT